MEGKSLLIAIIGLDGAGKTTQANLLYKWFKEQGENVYDVPNIDAYADWVFDTIAHKRGYSNAMDLFSPTTVDFAVAIDKMRDFTVYIEKLKNMNSMLISQRYTYCKIASAIQDNVQHIDLLEKIYSLVPKPDITFFMDIPPKIGVDRVMKRGVDEETQIGLENFKKSYECLSEYKNFIQIDGNKSVEEVHENIKKHVLEYMKTM